MVSKCYKCLYCGKPVPQIANKKHKLSCNDACRIAFKRKLKANNKSEQIKSEQPEIKSGQSNPNIGFLDNLEKCRYCSKDLPRLQSPRKNLGACYECAVQRGGTLSCRPNLGGHRISDIPHFTGELTDYEAQHYKPASELHPHEFNPVSKPGDKHYEEVV